MTKDVDKNEHTVQLEKEVKYYRQRLDEISAKTLQSDLTITRLRRIESQKQKAFNLLSNLQKIIGTTKDRRTIFRDTIDLIMSSIGMDKSILLVPGRITNDFRPFYWAGYGEKKYSDFKNLTIEFPPEFFQSQKCIIVNGSTEKTSFTEFLQARLKLPFFICTSVVTQNKVSALILAGRNVEKLPFYEPLNDGDIDTFQAISGFLESLLLSLVLTKQTKNAQKLKVQSDAKREAKEKFFANMSHELRTPLNAILGYSDMALEEISTESERIESLKIIYRSGKHLLQLINNILDLSKIEANKDQLEIVELTLVNVLEEIDEMFQILSSDKGIKFSIDYQYPLPYKIFTDPLKLKQILINLCGNAIKFTENGTVSVNVSYQSTDNKVFFKIIDSGIGISADIQEDIFEAFTQADSSTTRNYGGTGLGLNLSKAYANILGGDVVVTSKPGEGSTFTVSIDPGNVNNHDLVESTDNNTLCEIDSSRNRVPPKLNARILYADDNLDSQRLVSGLIKQTSSSIKLVSNGLLALSAYKDEEYDLVLTDIRMPVMNGLELAEKLLKLNSDLPIVAVTANITEHELKKYKKIGFKSILEKPISKQKLYEVLAEYLETVV